MAKFSTQWYNHGGYERKPRRYFVEYILSNGKTVVVDYQEEGDALSLAERLQNPAMSGGATFVRTYKVWRGKEVSL